MRKKDPNDFSLTRNEQKVLKNIIDIARISDSEIARTMGLSQQAIFKIRKKLEDAGIIEGYIPVINYRKIGISLMVLMSVKISSSVWGRFDEYEVNERLKKIPFVISAYRIPESDVSHFLLMGFRDSSQKDIFMMTLQKECSDEIEVKNVYPFTVNRIIMQNPMNLFHQLMDEKSFNIGSLFQ
ncbi:MAG: winged helix-turn-helix transcriptional regulator [Candidatus Aenigmarchaeota archaeon]|nr:winged helix-turn-helix transcriptional regulator [Candidatus Aenigmarchaeota archaeon]